MSQEIAPVICDGCGADITDTGNCEDYRLVLRSEPLMPWYVRRGQRGGVVTSMAVMPAIASPKHFCGLKCLREWVTKEKDQGSGLASLHLEHGDPKLACPHLHTQRCETDLGTAASARQLTRPGFGWLAGIGTVPSISR